MTAREALTSTDYSALRNYFGEQVDTETRVKLCSFALLMMLRHVKGLGDEVRLAPDGTMTVQQILNMRVPRILRMSITDLEEAIRESEREGRSHRGKVPI